MKRVTATILILVTMLTLLAGCNTQQENEYSKYEESIFDYFDTITQVIGYAKSQEEFDSHIGVIREKLEKLNNLFDIYNDYEGINNIKTINDNAGIKPVKVDKEIIDLILFSKEWYEKTDGKVNIAMGPVLRIWHDYREKGSYDPREAKLPPMEELQEAEKYTDINKVIVDTENSTVYLTDERMSLDVGAVAKGYATEIIAQEAMAKGFESGLIALSSNIRVVGKPLDGIRERWGISLHNPDKFALSEDEDSTLDTIFITDTSIVSSGDYQRFYVVDGKVIHHLIDPESLMPGDYYRAVTVEVEDSGVADALSTAVFLMSYEESRSLVESIDGAEAVWIMQDGEVRATDGMKKIMKSNGASGAESE